MKKVIITVMVALIALTVSCGTEKGDTKKEEVTAESNTNNQAAEDYKDNSKDSETAKNTSESANGSTAGSTKTQKENNSNTNGKKKIYKDKLDKIQEEVKGYATTYGESTNGRKNAAGLEYDKWDGALNEIYSELKKDLSPSDMSKLEKEEKLWIKTKEEKAKTASEEMKGGTEEGVIYSASLATSTKERCYELVEKYMK